MLRQLPWLSSCFWVQFKVQDMDIIQKTIFPYAILLGLSNLLVLLVLRVPSLSAAHWIATQERAFSVVAPGDVEGTPFTKRSDWPSCLVGLDSFLKTIFKSAFLSVNVLTFKKKICCFNCCFNVCFSYHLGVELCLSELWLFTCKWFLITLQATLSMLELEGWDMSVICIHN